MSKHIFTWLHKSASGQVIGEIKRFIDASGSKQDIPYYISNATGGFGKGTTEAMKNKGNPLFGLETIVDKNNPVIACEGQKCATAFAGLSYQCITTILGATNAKSSDFTEIKGIKEVFLFPDNNPVGEKYLRDIVEILSAFDSPPAMKIVRLPNLPGGGDVCDWLKSQPELQDWDEYASLENHPAASIIRVRLDKVIKTNFHTATSERIDLPEPEEIPKPIPLENRILPKMPNDIISGWLGDMIEAVMDATETPRELPLAIGLGVLSTSCQRKYIIEINPSHKEPLNIWTLPTLPSGHRKSAAVKIMVEPLLIYEQEKVKEILPQIQEAISKHKTIESKINKLRKDAANKKSLDFDDAQHEIILLEKSLPTIPVVPRLWVQDITPETLGAKMAEHEERLSIISPEGGIIEIMAGRYNQGIPNLDIFLQSHAGDSVRVDRMTRDSVFMGSPALTICLSPQPDVLLSLASKREFRGRGLLARFLYFLPKSNLGHRTLQTRPIPPIVKASYLNNIKSLLNIPESDIPYTLTMEQTALNELMLFAHTIEPQLGEGGKFEYISDWGSKLVGAAARISGLLHCANYASCPEKILTLQISKDTVVKAITLAAICSEHALAAFDLMGADPNINGAKKIWKWVDKNRYAEFSARNCFDAMKGSFKRMNELQLALDVLVERHYIFSRIKPFSERKPGRPPSTTYFVSPHITEQWR